MICHYCHQPLARREAHDLRVMRPAHKACHIARLAEGPSSHLKIVSQPLPPSVARTLPRWTRGIQ